MRPISPEMAARLGYGRVGEGLGCCCDGRQATRRAEAKAPAHHQREVEGGAVNEHPFSGLLLSLEMDTAQPAADEEVCERALQLLCALWPRGTVFIHGILDITLGLARRGPLRCPEVRAHTGFAARSLGPRHRMPLMAEVRRPADSPTHCSASSRWRFDSLPGRAAGWATR